MRILEVLNESIIAKMVSNPQDYIWDILDAMMILGIDGPNDEEGEADEEELASWISMWASNLVQYVQNGQMTIYRAIAVPDSWKPKKLGIYWSFDPKFAIAYNSNHGGDPVILTGVVAEEWINIPITVAMQELTEEEVRVRDSAPIKIIAATRSGQPVLPHLIGRTFPA